MNNNPKIASGLERESPILKGLSRIEALAKETEAAIQSLSDILSPILSPAKPQDESKGEVVNPSSEMENYIISIADRADQNLRFIYDIKKRLQI